MKLLLVEDDHMIGESLREGLKLQNYTVNWVREASDALYALTNEEYDIMLLDLGLPDMNGIELLRSVRERGLHLPVLILTAKDAISDKVKGLDAGADDYLVKPFSLEEVTARIRAILRRKEGRSNLLIKFGELTLNPKTYEVTTSQSSCQLSAKEFALLQILIETAGAPLSKTQIEERLYGWDDAQQSNTVEVFIHSLRRKIGPQWIKNIRGLGYFIPLYPTRG